jgi:P-type Ca2+ transporter type 2C
VKKHLKIIARCTAEDKFVLVAGIKQKGGLVGMTGDSIADAEALKKADVGLCMGSGCDVAKDNSDLVILDNDFVSIHRSVKWGRAIFDNVRKFIQFQLTINIVICTITIIGGCTLGHAPLNVVQMLWTNLIMDILGAIAIGTEPYKKK